MRTSLLYSILMISFFQATAQKQRLVGDTSAFLCKNDSISYFMLQELEYQKIDTVIEILYDFDNGRLEHSKKIILWKQGNKSQARIITGCDNIYQDTIFSVDLSKIFDYIDTTDIKDISFPLDEDDGRSHDTGYFIYIKMGTKTLPFQVRNNALSKKSNTQKTGGDNRIILTNMIRETIL